jgi:hypothetical protein
LYKFHPLADLFPLLSEGELQELANDIRERGLLEPIQWAVVAAKIANMTHGGNRKPESQEANLPLDPVVTQDIAADMLNVSARSIRSVKLVGVRYE